MIREHVNLILSVSFVMVKLLFELECLSWCLTHFLLRKHDFWFQFCVLFNQNLEFLFDLLLFISKSIDLLFVTIDLFFQSNWLSFIINCFFLGHWELVSYLMRISLEFLLNYYFVLEFFLKWFYSSIDLSKTCKLFLFKVYSFTCNSQFFL